MKKKTTIHFNILTNAVSNQTIAKIDFKYEIDNEDVLRFLVFAQYAHQLKTLVKRYHFSMSLLPENVGQNKKKKP